MNTRNKTWVDALYDGSLDDMNPKEVSELIGYITPNDNVWMVTMIDEGTFYDCQTQDSAEILSTNQQILFKLLQR